MKGKIHSFQSLGTLDGPGVRFVTFLHGCNLHCGYCHNVDVCKGEYTEYSPEEIMEKILRYREYFGKDGGVTLSGGEPLLQTDFVSELFTLCKKNNIHTALDTSGSIWNDKVKELLNLCDLVLLDIKMTNDRDYKKYIGCGIDTPLAFLDYLEANHIPCYIRHVITGGLNDTADNIKALKKIISGKRCIEKVELLPFKKMCAQKYQAMGLDFPFASYTEPSQDVIDFLNNILTTA